MTVPAHLGEGTSRRRVLGVEIDPVTMADTVARCSKAIDDREALVIGVVNAAKLVKMQSDAELRAAVLGCNLIIPDGMAVVWASRLLGQRLPERVAGVDLFLRLLEHAHERSRSVYLLGATDDVLHKVEAYIAEHFPRVRIVGARNGYFDDSEDSTVVVGVRAAGPDMLFVGISSPKKELFLARWGRELGVPVCHGIGGSFDVVAGYVKRAPQIWQDLGFEWLYRVVQEPRRMWKRYLTTNSAFLWLLARELVGRVFRRG